MKEEKSKKPKTASKIVKNANKKDEFNKNHVDEFNNKKSERIKNNVEDGENFGGI